MSKKVLVIGGGIIGLCTAYYLNQDGYEVTVVDQSAMNGGASYVNAGYISPSHFVPLAAPGVMKQGIKWMLDSASPLYIKPRLDPNFLKWTWAFNNSCSVSQVEKAIPAINNITVWSQELYADFLNQEEFKFHYEKKGLLMLCQTQHMLDEEISVVERAQQMGLRAKELSREDLKQLEPNIEIDAIGAAYFECDHHSTPHEFMDLLKKNLVKSGVNIYAEEKVEDLEVHQNTIKKIVTNKRSLEADEVVLAAGSWSSRLSKKVNLNLLLEAGKGYRIDTLEQTNISIPAILAESKVAVTPMNGFTRFAGTMEIAGINHNINKKRVGAIAKAAQSYYPSVNLKTQELETASCGLRPVSPDGLPYIGRTSKCKNLTIATGHAMLGWTMGTGTGKLVAEIIGNKKTSINTDAFLPDRSF